MCQRMKKPPLQSQLPKNSFETLCGAHPPPTLRRWCMGGGSYYAKGIGLARLCALCAGGEKQSQKANRITRSLKCRGNIRIATAAREWTMALATKCANTTRRIAGALLGSFGRAVIWRMSRGNAGTEKQADTSEKPAFFRVQDTRNISSFLFPRERAGRRKGTAACARKRAGERRKVCAKRCVWSLF